MKNQCKMAELKDELRHKDRQLRELGVAILEVINAHETENGKAIVDNIHMIGLHNDFCSVFGCTCEDHMPKVMERLGL